jgi:hypothetical protein
MPWRKTGTVRRLHVSLLAEYVNEPYVTPMANPAPVLPVMIRPTLGVRLLLESAEKDEPYWVITGPARIGGDPRCRRCPDAGP